MMSNNFSTQIPSASALSTHEEQPRSSETMEVDAFKRNSTFTAVSR